MIGANGAGKTCTLKAIMGLIPRKAGALRLGGTDLTRVPARDMVRHGIGYVPEGRHVFAGLSVEKNLLLGADAKPWKGETRETLAQVYDLFPVLGDVQDGAGRVTLAGDTPTGTAPGRDITALEWTPGGTGADRTAADGMSGLTVRQG